MGELSPSARRVQEALARHGLELDVVELSRSARSAVEAAHAIGCSVAQIAKSLIFEGAVSGQPILVIASGSSRVDEARLAEFVGEPIAKANAGFVREHTGFAIGGVPPSGHASPLPTYIDQELLQYPEIWAAAGTPHAVFRLTPDDLLAVTGGRVVVVR